VTGWRRSEVLTLKPTQVDLQAGIVRLEPGETKNRDGRAIHVTADVLKILKGQLASITRLTRQGMITPYAFHRPNGSPIKDFREAWTSACELGGYPDALVHNFRRTAVRNLERAGVPRSTSMQITGHKTESVFRRYAIVNYQMHKAAAAKLTAYAVEETARQRTTGQLRRFQARGASVNARLKSRPPEGHALPQRQDPLKFPRNLVPEVGIEPTRGVNPTGF
jgi:integrase